MHYAESIATNRTGRVGALRRAYGVGDLPCLIGVVADLDADRVALRYAGDTVAYGVLATEIAALSEAMGGALEPEALIQVVVSGQLPGLMDGEAGGLTAALEALVDDAVLAAADVLDPKLAPVETLTTQFRAQVQRTPDAVAIDYEGQILTYAEFASRVTVLAHHLRTLGVGPDVLVGLAVRRSFELLVGMYAILEAGGAYVPIDPDHPAERTSYVLEVAQPAVVLTTTADRPPFDIAAPVLAIDEFEATARELGVSGDRLLSPADDPESAQPGPDNLAYVIFTSGSTGRPKGVAIPHRAVIAFLRWQQRQFRLTDQDAVLFKTSTTFDASVWEIFWPLQVGARVAMTSPTGHLDAAYLVRVIRESRVTTAFFVTSMLAALVGEVIRSGEEMPDSLRYLLTGGETVPVGTAADFRSVSGATLFDVYGPTESTVLATSHEVTAADVDSIPIGQPGDDVDVLVLDEDLRPVPPGVVGELYIAGPQLARGYAGRPGLTAERFVANPEGPAGDRMYRTGDLVRWVSNADNGSDELEYVGRSDFQVKMRGQRIELGEVEAALRRSPAVAQAVVLMHTRPSGEQALVGYVVAAAGHEIDSAAVLSTARTHVPEYMVPTLLVPLAEFPLNVNGKVDRRALPEPDFADAAAAYRAPATPAEEAVAAIFADLLELRTVGADDDFFVLGGNSLIATRAIARIREALGVHVDVRDFFERPTVAALAALGEGATGTVRPPLTAGPRPDHIPLSPAQQRMWFLNHYARSEYDPTADEFDPSAVDNMPFALRLRGDLDPGALAAAFADVIERHESLRTYYPATEAGPAQVVLPEAAVDLTPREVPEDQLAATVLALAAQGFDVTAEVPLRARLLRSGPGDHTLVVVAHHIAADGASIGPLVRDLVMAYLARQSGQRPQYEPLAVQYADYTLWQRAWMGDEADPESVSARQIAFWASELADLPVQIDLPADRPRPAVSSFRGATFETVLDAELRAAVDKVAAAHRATPFMVLHAALAAVLARLSNTGDIVIGSPAAGRGDQALDDLVGMFVNTLVLRTEVRGADSFEALLGHVRDRDLRAFAHRDVPFERLVEVLNPPRARNRHPLFQVALFMQNLSGLNASLPGLSAEQLAFDPGIAKFDLQLTVVADGDRYRVEYTYAADLFDDHTVREFAAKFTRLLSAATADTERPVGDIELLDAGERDYVLSSWNATGARVPDLFLHQGFDAQVARTPKARALVFGDTELTYTELSERANRLARHLIAAGVGPESLVVLAMSRSVELVVAMYAVLHAGGAYVPVDPAHPAERIAHILATANPHAVLTTRRDGFTAPETVEAATYYLDELDLADVSAAKLADRERRAPLHPDHPAYVLFTSGSTGKPKGVAVTHRAIANQLAWMQAEYGVRGTDVYLQKTATTFDVSLWGYFLPLRAGATLVVATPDGHRDPRYIAETIARHGVTLTDFVPSMLAVFAAHAEAGELDSLRDVFVIGEALPPETVSAFWAVSDAGVHNLYGPTEAAVSITFREAHRSDTLAVPIGEPEWNSQVFVLDARLRPVAIGVPGELYLAGVQLARGYHGRVDLTSDRFVANPFGRPGERMYRTGDLVKWTEDGELVYLERLDFQIKFRGQRIELAEIESALLLAPEVSQAAVRLVDADSGDYLAGYVVAAPGADPDPEALRAGLTRLLPSYMVPTALLVLPELPLNSSGKLDRKALPVPQLRARAFREPVDPAQHLVAGVFAEVLELERVGLDDDFFALGGSSLDAARVTSRIGAELDARVPVRLLFEASSVEGLAALLAAANPDAARPRLAARPRPQRIPLSPAQQRLWFLNRLEAEDGEHSVYNLPIVLRLTGQLRIAELEQAALDVLGRHESLRTVYPDSESGPYQEILDIADVGLSLNPILVPAADLPGTVAAFAAAGFDVTRELPSRIGLFLADEDGDTPEYVLAVVVHHIAADALSLSPLIGDLMRSYLARVAGQEPGWEPLAVQYADYSLWQHELLGDAEQPGSLAHQQLEFWRETLAGLPPQLALPADRPRPAVATNAGAAVPFSVDDAVAAGLRELARAHGVTLFMVVHAAFAALLARVSGAADIPVASPIGGRGDRELDALIGMFVNTLVLRTRVDADRPFTELLGRVRAADLAAFAHAELPFERIVDALDVDRTTGAPPLAQVMLSFNDARMSGGAGAFALPELSVTPVEIDDPTVKFDLHLVVGELGDGAGLTGNLRYATEMFDAATAAALTEQFGRLLAAVAADGTVPVGEIDILGDDQRALVVDTWNDTAFDVDAALGLAPESAGDAKTLIALFEQQAARTPDAIALTFEGASLTYAEFASRVHRLARWLISEGVGPESLVALGMRRSLDLLIGMYAVSAAGAGYLPLDPDHPADRLEYILDTADPVTVLTSGTDLLLDTAQVRIDLLDLTGVPDAPLTDADRVAPLRDSNTAYVIFTSGSTGRPKGVAVSHAAIVNRLVWGRAAHGLTAADVVLQKTPMTFDVSVPEFFLPLQIGARLVIAKPDGHTDPAYLAELIAREGITVAHFVPSMLTVFVAEEAAAHCTSLRIVFASGEALSAKPAHRLRELTGAELHNLYGPTEAAVEVAYHRVTDTDVDAVPIGRPTFNTRLYVLDSRLRPVPVGVAGELYLAGDQLAVGYVARPELTADRFVANPFGTSERMYRTGDLVKWNRDGELEYLGRTDFQVKLRGLRIELGEIEAALTAHPAVAQAVVVVHGSGADAQLVAYLVPTAGAEISVPALKAGLAQRLPVYMVPAVLIALDAFPVNSSGKLDRGALPAPAAATAAFRAATGGEERIVAEVFAALLGVPRVGADDDFFSLGGNSLIATQLVARLGKAAGVRIPLRAVFEDATVSGLAARIRAADAEALVELPPVVTQERGERIPLSIAQQRLWFLNRFDVRDGYTIPFALRLSGALNIEAMAAAVADVVDRHETLRTIYPEHDGQASQLVLPAGTRLIDLVPEPVTTAELPGLVESVARTAFDVTAEVPFRIRLLELTDEPGTHLLVLVVHHIAADGWSFGPLTRDIATAYVARCAGETPHLAPLPVQYADYALWQRAALGSPEDPESVLAQQLSHWTRRLHGVPDVLALPTDRPRPAVASGRGAGFSGRLDAELHTAVLAFAAERRVTPFMVLHTALSVTLARLSGSTDIVIGAPVAGRGDEALDDLVGMFVNTLVLRTEVRPDAALGDLLTQVRDTDLTAFDHAVVPFEMLVEAVNPVRSQAHAPLAQVTLTLQNHHRPSIELNRLAIEALTVDATATQFDLDWTLAETTGADGAPGGIDVYITYATDLFDADTVGGFQDTFERVLRALLADPRVTAGDVEIMSRAERGTLLVERNATTRPLPAETLAGLLDARAAQDPDADALVFEGERIGWAELARRANRLGRLLIAHGVGPDAVVGVTAERCVDMVVAMYGVVAAGAAYVPVDPSHPADRIAHVLGTSNVTLALSVGGATLPEPAGVRVLDIAELAESGALEVFSDAPITDADRLGVLRPDNLAYVLYTSGSTGLPKGVATSHRAIMNQLRWLEERYGVTRADRIMQRAPLAFDVSVWECFLPAMVGAPLVIPRPGPLDLDYLAGLMREFGVTIAEHVPSVLAALIAEGHGDALRSFRHLHTGGEALPVELLGRLRDLVGGAVHNAYGPTEAAISAVYHEFSDADPDFEVAIGRPNWNTRAYVLDARMRPVPSGVVGELYLAGAQLARGYQGRGALTADRFVADPFGVPGTRMYRTGDLVRWNRAGDLVYMGRNDFQIKLRGQRIELGEIEAALLSAPAVTNAVVLLAKDTGGADCLVGYVSGDRVDSDAVLAHARAQLPSYMVPAHVAVLESMPLTTVGKLDRAALPPVEFTAATVAYREPAPGAEATIAALAGELLGGITLGADDDFFTRGGNSLLGMRLIARANAALGTELGVRQLFEAPTVAGLAALAVAAGPGLPLRRMPRPERIPLSPVQTRMWLLNRLDPESAAYNLPAAVRITGAIDTSVLLAAFADVVGRHESLRTLYPADADGTGYQLILPAETAPLPLEIHTGPGAADPAFLAAFAATGFDVTTTVPIRAALLRESEHSHVLLVVQHHIAGDGSSTNPLLRDTITAYLSRAAGHAPEWTELPVQYADFALWQRAKLELVGDRELAFWSQTLRDLPDELPLPTDRPRPEVASGHGAYLHTTVDAELAAAVERIAVAHNVTPFMVWHAALTVLLARLSATTDIAIGTPIEGRGHAALDDLVGMFVNTLVLRTRPDLGRGFDALLARTREADLAAFDHATVPFDQVVDALGVPRTQARNPLFTVALAYMNLDAPAYSAPGLTLAGVDFEAPVSRFDLQLTVSDQPDADGRLAIEWNYATDLFDAETIASFATRMDRVLRAVTADATAPIGDIELMDADERRDVLERWGAQGIDAGESDHTLSSRFDRAVTAHAHRVAVCFGDERLTYAELDRRANRLARRLIDTGAGPESLVAVLLPRSAELVVALLAVLKAGAGYVPLDPSSPADRLAYVLSDAKPTSVITDSTVRTELPEGLDIVRLDDDSRDWPDTPITDADRRAPLRAAHLAYVIYTSGSTGRPKGVAVAHRNVVRLMDNIVPEFGFDAEDVWTLFHSYAFDFSVWELWGPLLYGGKLVVVDYYVSRSPEQFLELLRREQVTVLNQTPSAFYQLAEADRHATADALPPLALRYLILGGEALELRRLSDWVARHGDSHPRVVNIYGITETTVHVSHRPLDAGIIAAATGSMIGHAIAGLHVYVLDERLRPVPVGVAGELYVAGAQLSRGYLGRPDLSAARFVASPFGGPGERLYRSGDVARWNRAGELEYLGRADDQVQVRGFRIELGEIEAAVLAQPGIAQAAVIVREDQPGDLRIVAYVVPDAGVAPVLDAVRDGAAERLPSYMIPSALVVVDQIPLTVNGKLDRRALPKPELRTAEYIAPRTEAERTVAEVVAGVLGLEDAQRVGLADDFFELGGNSLTATQLAARLTAAFDVHIPVRAVFEHTGIEALAAAVLAVERTPARPPLVPRTGDGPAPVSLAQQRIWFLNRLDPDSAAYNIPLPIRLTGELDVAALRAAIADVVVRHEVLRTVYPETATGPVQVVLPATAVAELPALEPIPVTEQTVTAAVAELIGQGFDVTAAVPLRAALFRLAPEDHVIVVVMHHIAGDGSSLAPLARDVMLAYAARKSGTAPAWPPLPVQYSDYAVWQHELLGSEDDPTSLVSRQLAFWTETLAGLPPLLTVPADRPRPVVLDTEGRRVDFAIDPETHGALAELGRTAGATLFMTVHAAFAALLSRLTGSTDIAVGTPVAGRGEAALDDLVGMFVNTLVLRTEVAPAESFTELVRTVRARDVAAFDNVDVPFERLVEVLNPERSTARHPLVQVGFTFHNQDQAALDLDGLGVSAVEFDTDVSQFDLHLIVTDRRDADGAPAGMTATMTYSTALFEEATVAGFAERLVRLLSGVLANPHTPIGDVDILGPAESARLLRDWNATGPAFPVAGLLDAFDAQVRRTPFAIAVVEQGRSLTYRDFAERVDRLARVLIGAGVGPESLVALALPRSLELLVAMYAVVRAGGAYVPLDPSHPAERTAMVLETAAPRVVLTGTRGMALPDGLASRTNVIDVACADDQSLPGNAIRDEERRAPSSPWDPAYVIFTSGSTGKPKGVTVPHAAVAHQLDWMQSEYRLGASDSVLWMTSAAFDLSIWELWWALRTGAHLVLAPEGAQHDPEGLLELVRRESVTTLTLVPSLLAMLVDVAGAALPASLRRLLVIGEALPAQTLRRAKTATAARIDNLYGPTEAAVSVTRFRTDTEIHQAVVPIGTPEAGSRVFVLDDRLRPVPVGVTGELYLSGAQLARGYHARPDLTAERFVADPFGPAGSRLYRTGDLVRWTRATGETEGGVLEFVERRDFQVKVRGYRIELAEIEHALRSDPAISDAVVVVDGTGETARLVGYFAAAGADPARVRARLTGLLPSYMVPEALIALDAVPRNANGKVDRTALPAPEFAQRTYRAPVTATETAVCAVFAEVLDAERIGLDDNFFELGGNSLLAVRLATRLGEELGQRVPVVLVFTASTPGELAGALGAPGGFDTDAAFGVLLPIRPAGTGAPLFCVHPIGGVAWSFAGLAAHLDEDRPIYGLQSPTLAADVPLPDSIEEWAARYVREIRAVQPEGPYHLLGWSLGGVLAHAMAVRLQDEGQEVATLAMLDSSLDSEVDAEDAVPVTELLGEVPGLIDVEAEIGADRIARILAGAAAAFPLIGAYRPRRFKGDLLYFHAALDDPSGAVGVAGWTDAIDGVLENHAVPTTHWRMTSPDALVRIARVLNAVAPRI
ncbi:amino acid adenylation domain-containing protein [Nocardia yunnanensis]|uniref:Amino acid adenylation domain-containing protein n=1 Tax=Nocardia yunnanensis TaxID=2382165 RepID=A0A386Z7T1_9NOCA|nr:non-ribosomal peptide synthetase [Nocardia yunnanensis]AYF73656.1 amino acid adenylation domain-containing protein [Nocardia yunnanensis]